MRGSIVTPILRSRKGHDRSTIGLPLRALPTSSLAFALIESDADPVFFAPDDVTGLPDMVSLDYQNENVGNADRTRNAQRRTGL